MHRAERVLEAAVLGGRKDPARRLELGNPPQALDPRRVDDVLLGGLAGHAAGPRELDVLMDRIRDEPAALIRVSGALHGPSVRPTPRSGLGRAEQQVPIHRADGDDVHAAVALHVEPDHVAGPATPELLVELFLAPHTDAVDRHDAVALAEAGGARGPGRREVVDD